jgi:hypothetical protein
MKAAKMTKGTYQEIHTRIQACRSMDELFDLVNPKGRYYKLNLQNLKTDKRPTIEFRQHSATSYMRKVEPWVRFCMTFVQNSMTLDTPRESFGDSLGVDEEFDELFDCLIQDPALKRYYTIRREKLRSTGVDIETEGTTLDGN